MTKALFVTPRGLLHSGAGPLGRLGRQAVQLAEATRILREHLAPPLADHAAVAAIREPNLVVVVDSPAWAARLRYQSAGILDHFAAALGRPRLTHLKTLVRPPILEPESSRLPVRRALRPSSQLIRKVSETLEAGPLRDSVARLAEPEAERAGDNARRAPSAEHGGPVNVNQPVDGLDTGCMKMMGRSTTSS